MTRHTAVSRIVLLVSTLFTVLGIEFAARWFELAPAITRVEIDTKYGQFISTGNPLLPYVPKPGIGSVSSYGIRDREYSLEKDPGTYRIVVLGDSVGFGLCSIYEDLLPLDIVFHEVLETELNKGTQRFEVINLAVSGYNTRHETAFLEEKGLVLDPDLVLVAYVFNDHHEVPSIEERTLRRDGNYESAASLAEAISKHAILKSHFIRALWYRFGEASKIEAQRRSRTQLEYEQKVTQDFGRLVELSRLHDFEVLVVIFPSLQQEEGVYLDEWRHQIIAKISAQGGFQSLDLLPAFLEAGKGDLVPLQEPCLSLHPGEFGHRVAGLAIFKYLSSARESAR